MIFRALGITKFEERFSSNYPPDDHYFLGFGLNASISVWDADSSSDSYPYWLIIKAPMSWGEALDAVPTKLETVAALLQNVGLKPKPGLD